MDDLPSKQRTSFGGCLNLKLLLVFQHFNSSKILPAHIRKSAFVQIIIFIWGTDRTTLHITFVSVQE